MKLTHIKIAGFKSFADPIHIPVPSHLVGIVGPNGCGKSNVIDAARWVLGEMSAKQLRGSLMQDVIFDGSGDRKPAFRASVELIFDNSLSRAGGLWSKYQEISVKRVIDRSGDSSYIINNQQVRRRDVADMFLGTGLGGRGYAIIEQGMISQIIDAKPEELRGFLEEAAGTSKYRERRRETESRLRSTEENLSRVQDIREELRRQVSHLSKQAKMATKYFELKEQAKVREAMLVSLKLKRAREEKAIFQNNLANDILKIDQINSSIAKLIKQIEAEKQKYEELVKLLDKRQESLYEANTELSKLEQKIEFNKETKRKNEQRSKDIDLELRSQEKGKERLQLQLVEEEARSEEIEAYKIEKRRHLSDEMGKMPVVDDLLQTEHVDYEECQKKIMATKQAVELVKTKKEHAVEVSSNLNTRLKRLEDERGALEIPNQSGLIRLDHELKSIEEEQDTKLKDLGKLKKEMTLLSHALEKEQKEFDQINSELSEVTARVDALQHIQRKTVGQEQVNKWLDVRSIEGKARLWEGINIKPGWDTAVEAVLRERLNSIEVEDLSKIFDEDKSPPPGKISFHS